MRWETYGWQMGKITGTITSATPQLLKKFNYRIVWAEQPVAVPVVARDEGDELQLGGLGLRALHARRLVQRVPLEPLVRQECRLARAP